MKTKLLWLFVCSAMLACATNVTYSVPDTIYPAGSHLFNVKAYGAVGDGVTDDTAAIRAAMAAAHADTTANGSDQTVYFPQGNYLISDTLWWNGGQTSSSTSWFSALRFEGQNKSNTFITLADSTFTNASCTIGGSVAASAMCRSVLYTANNGQTNNNGAGESAYKNDIWNLTIDTGTGNPGAVGIDWQCSNRGELKNVDIISGDGSGKAGLNTSISLANSTGQGPCLVKNVHVSGFDYANYGNTPAGEVGLTYEYWDQQNQNIAGFFHAGSSAWLHNVSSTNTVPAFISCSSTAGFGAAHGCAKNSGNLVLIDANLSGGSGSVSAVLIENSQAHQGAAFLRNVTSSGYQSALATGTADTMVAGSTITEFAFPAGISKFGGAIASLNLPNIPNTPDFSSNNFGAGTSIDANGFSTADCTNMGPSATSPGDWADVTCYGANRTGGGASTNAANIQAALNSGRPIVYFPWGKYLTQGILHIPSTVRKIIGLDSYILSTVSPTFSCESTSGNSVEIRLFAMPTGPNPAFSNSCTGPLVIANVGQNAAGYRDARSGNTVYFEDYAGPYPTTFSNSTVYARQFDIEGGYPTFTNSTAWILGYKTESGGCGTGSTPCPTLFTATGGNVEVLGARNFLNSETVEGHPEYSFTDSSFSLAGLWSANGWNPTVSETKTGITQGYFAEGTGFNSVGSSIGLYAGHGTGTVVPPQSPSVILKWSTSPSTGVAGYNAYRSTVPGGPYTRLNSALIAGTTYTDLAPVPCSANYYVATAVTTSGAESPYSVQAQASLPCGLISSFASSPGSITSGDPSTLSWTTRASSVSISGLGVVAAPSGTASVSPTATKIYTLTATGGGVSQTATATVNVAASTVGTHYVSSVSGSDSNDGLSPDRPWRSIGKVSATAFSPDNRILFKAGEGWSGATLTTSSNGTSGHQIIYGSYGSGAKPVIDGGGSLGTCVSITRNFITLNGLAIRNCATLISGPNVAGTQVLNVDMKNGSVWGYRAATGLGTTLVDHTTYTIDPGVHMQAWAFDLGGATSSTSITLTNNTCNLTQVASGNAPGCMEVFATSNALIQYNTSHGGQQAYSIKPNGVTVTGGRIIDNYADGVISGSGGDGEVVELEGASGNPQSGVTVARNILVCNPSSTNGNTDLIGVFQSNSNFIYGNVLLGACNVSASITSLARMVHLSSNSANNHIHNNTFSGNLGIRPDQVAIEIGSGSGGDFKNNIFNAVAKGIHANGGSGSVSEDYNIYSPSVATPTLGIITNGIHSQTSTDPQFAVSPPVSANDVKLQSGSPAIGFGATLGTPYNLILGMGGTSSPYPVFTQAVPYANGAFGFGAGVGGGPPGSPGILSFLASPTTVVSGSPVSLTWATTDATNQTIACGSDAPFPVTGDSGSISISPTVTETCTLTASNDVGDTTATTTITVAVPVAPVIESFTADPASIPFDHLSGLQWVVDGADSITIDGFGDVRAFNFLLVRPRTTTTYTMRAINPVGETDATVTVEVFTPVGPAAENIRYHHIRQYDRRGNGHEFQMFAGWPPPVPNYPGLYDADGNVFPAQPRGNTSAVQMADSTRDYTEGHTLAFDANGNARDSGAFPGQGQNGCGVWFQEEPLGTRDGSNTTFYLSYQPGPPFVILTVNGIVQNPYVVQSRNAEFFLSANQITMDVAPKASDSFVIWYFACTEIEVPPPPVPSTPSYDTISLWAAASSASGGAPFGRPALSYSVDGGSTWVGTDGLSSGAGGTDIHVFPTGTFTEQALDFPMSSTITDLSLLRVRVWLGSTLFTGFTLIPNDQLDLYNVAVSGPDGSAKAGLATVIDSGADGNSAVSNPLFAVDADADTPATFARITRSFYNAFVYGKFIELSGFGE